MLSKVEFAPMFWGPQKTSQWNQRLCEMHKHTLHELMAFNEPDVSGHELCMEQVNPWKSNGVRFRSPAIVWNFLVDGVIF
jgi:Glycosyl hydrolase catalytic core